MDLFREHCIRRRTVMQGSLRTIQDTKMDLSSVTKDTEPKSFVAKAKRQQSKSIDSDNRSESPNSTHGADLNSFVCKTCDASFASAALVHRHMRTHNEQYDSDESASSSSSTEELSQRYTRKRRLEYNNNDKDDADPKRKRTINNNLINGHRLPCPVALCRNTDFQTVESLEVHLESEHPNYELQCPSCTLTFKNYRVLNLHRFMAHPSPAAKSQVTGFDDLTFIDFSSRKFPQIARTVCEQNYHKSVTELQFRCAKCSRDFPCESALDIHRQACFTPITKSNRHPSDSSDEDIKREDFFANLDLQNRSLKVKNDLVQDSGKDLADIQSILTVTSTGGLLEQLTQKNHELNHMTPPEMNLKENEREEETQDAFASEFRKMKLRGEFPCRLCTAIFPNLRALKGHNRVHLSGNGPGPYRCNMCPHSSLDKAALVRHMRTHNGDRPYECAVCNYAFTTKANCERHLRNRHNKVTREDVKRSIIYHPSEDPNNDEVNNKLNISREDIKRSFVFHTPESMEKDLERERTVSDRSTPVSHFPREQSMAFAKERLNIPIPRDLSIVIPQPRDILARHIAAEPSPKQEQLVQPRIKVRGLGQLTQIPEFQEDKNEPERDSEDEEDEKVPYCGDAPIDLSTSEGDVLDLSKKKSSEEPEFSPFNMSMTQQLLLAQQQILNMPKIDPASFYASQLSQLYRMPMPPPFPLNPYFLHSNPFLTPTASPQDIADMKERIQKEIIRGLQMSGGGLVNMDHTNILNNMALANERLQALQQQAAMSTPEPKPTTPVPVIKHEEEQLQNASLSPKQKPQQPIPQNSVKMVIKNGVLMPKQKQRRYRTERPFSCEHCSARFTLRSNMERHIKQQHPQYWSQRQRTNVGNLPRKISIPQPGAPFDCRMNFMKGGVPNENALNMNEPYKPISDQVKYAILAQQLKSQHVTNPYAAHINQSVINHLQEPKQEEDDIEEEDALVIDEDSEDEQKPTMIEEPNSMAKKVANEILMGVSKAQPHDINKDFDLKIAGNLISKNPHHLAMPPIIPTLVSQIKTNASPTDLSPKDAGTDLVPVSRLVENSVNQLPFGQYFKMSNPEAMKTDAVQSLTEGSEEDEEGLVASGSTSEGNNSGSDENRSESEVTNQQPQKKKSAYSLAPNRVSCPYCHRKFPWSSSLRRHVLTHTGQKPYKCPHCPLLFTTKSNCDRHLLRKHGGQGGAVGPTASLVVEATPQPVDAGASARVVPERPHKCSTCPSSTFSTLNNLKKHMTSKHCPGEHDEVSDKEETLSHHSDEEVRSEPPPCKVDSVPVPLNSDLPYKCHLCDTSYGERHECLDHIREQHSSEYELLVTKGALETGAVEESAVAAAGGKLELTEEHNGEDNMEQLRGKFPDYANRKVVCAFCMRRFWSAEDLRRHMRTHSGERPFSCDICRRRFTLKHSMLRHRKKHSGSSKSTSGEELSTASGDEDAHAERTDGRVHPETNSITLNGYQFSLSNKNLSVSPETPRNVNNNNSPPMAKGIMVDGKLRKYSTDDNECDIENGAGDLIGNLLGISDKGMINKLLSSADEAAKLLGVNK